MSDRADRFLNELIDDWQREGQIVSDDARRRFNRLALLLEQLVLAAGTPGFADVEAAYWDTVRLELASAALQAEAKVREAFNRTATRAVRFVIAAVGAV